jgi:V-type H+-transporting ATPase subunit A
MENKLFKAHKIMIPPRYNGKVTSVTPAGDFTILETILKCESNG